MSRQIHFDLARDILDKQLNDANNCPFGKVDGIVIALHDDAPPRILYIETGGVTALHRLPHWLRRVLEPIARRYGTKRGAPMIIPWQDVSDIGLDIDVDFDASQTQALRWERAAYRIVSRIPGS